MWFQVKNQWKFACKNIFLVKWHLLTYHKQLLPRKDFIIEQGIHSTEFKIPLSPRKYTNKVSLPACKHSGTLVRGTFVPTICWRKCPISRFIQAETSFCWAFAISTMIRHSLNYFLWQLARERPRRFDNEIIIEAIHYLNAEDSDFHRRLRTGFRSNIISSEFTSVNSAQVNSEK